MKAFYVFTVVVIHTWPRMKFTNSMATELFRAFGHNEGTNKNMRKHQSFKEYWNEGNHESKWVIIANTDWVTTLLVCNT